MVKKNNNLVIVLLIIAGIFLVTQTNILGNQSVVATQAAQSNDDCTFRTNVVPGGFYSASEAVIDVNIGPTLKAFKKQASIGKSWSYDQMKAYTSTIDASVKNPDNLKMLYNSNILYVYTPDGFGLRYLPSTSASDIFSCNGSSTTTLPVNSSTTTTQTPTTTLTPPAVGCNVAGQSCPSGQTCHTETGACWNNGGGSTTTYYYIMSNTCHSTTDNSDSTIVYYTTSADCTAHIATPPPFGSNMIYIYIALGVAAVGGLYYAWKKGMIKI